jgi:hypothetical protein
MLYGQALNAMANGCTQSILVLSALVPLESIMSAFPAGPLSAQAQAHADQPAANPFLTNR